MYLVHHELESVFIVVIIVIIVIFSSMMMMMMIIILITPIVLITTMTITLILILVLVVILLQAGLDMVNAVQCKCYLSICSDDGAAGDSINGRAPFLHGAVQLLGLLYLSMAGIHMQ